MEITAGLESWLAGRLPGTGAITVRPMSAGVATSNEMFEVVRGARRWVLRRPPPVKNAPGAQDVLREYRLLCSLEGTAVPHAAPVVSCEDQSVFERPFFVMQHVDGFSPQDPLPRAFAKTRRGLAFELVDALAKVAQVDWRAAGLEGFGRPAGFLARQVSRWHSQLEAYRTRELEGVDELAAWLEQNRPATGPIALMHGDYSFFNVMFAPAAPPRLVAIVDWESATIGDPLLDVGWLLAQWGEPELLERGITSRPGSPARGELAARYAERTGLDLSELRFYMVLALFKLACILEGGFARYARGDSDKSASQAGFGALVSRLITRARRFCDAETTWLLST